jgi:nucleoside-diphosphate-sugar epimerase
VLIVFTDSTMAETANGSTATFTPKNILVTGGCGFIASHVVIRLVKNYPQYKASGLRGKAGTLAAARACQREPRGVARNRIVPCFLFDFDLQYAYVPRGCVHVIAGMLTDGLPACC